MLKQILSQAATTAAISATGNAGGMTVNGLLFSSLVGGSSHAEADFAAHTIDLTLRSKDSEDVILMSQCRLLDFLKMSDYQGGFSTQAEGDNGTYYVAYVPLGLIKLAGEDSLELRVSMPGDASATYTLRVDAVELRDGSEQIVGYRNIVGDATEKLLPNALAIFNTTAASGNSIAVKDQVGAVVMTDYQVNDLGNALGKMEAYEDFGVVYQDKFGISQDCRVTFASSTYGLAMIQYFVEGRAGNRDDSYLAELRGLSEQIKASNPIKYNHLIASGLI